MKWNIRTKLLFTIFSTSLFVYGVAISYIGFNVREIAVNNAVKITDEVAANYANKLESSINTHFDVLRTLVYSISGINRVPPNMRDTVISDMLYNVIFDNPHYSSVAISMELSAYDSAYKKPYGRKRIIHYWGDGLIRYTKETLNLDGDDLLGLYYQIKQQKAEIITPPYNFSFTGLKTDEVLMTTVAVPIIKNDDFAGLVGIDVTIEQLKEMVNTFQPFENSYAMLVSDAGRIVSAPSDSLINITITRYFPHEESKYKIQENILKGENFSFFTKDSTGKESYVCFSPIKLGRNQIKWSMVSVLPIELITKKADNLVLVTIVVAFFGLVVLFFVILYFANKISKPINKTTRILSDLSIGNIDKSKKMTVKSTDEIGDIRRSVNSLIEGLIITAGFAETIGEGNLETEFKPLSDKDILGNALLKMRSSLKLAREEEAKRKEIDARANWSTLGEAKFGEILRMYQDNMEEFSYNIISNLVKYINVNQGGLFIINDEDKNNIYIELTASYAYDRRKVLNKKIQIGVGLVGRAVKEGETIYMTNLPNDYINITSGLGENNPSCLLIVPLKFNEQIYAVVELASFNEIEKYQRDFVEKIGESIALTIANLKINIRTSRLLEELKIQSEELASQEEEMRQNMEEMQATQEELSRRADTYSNIIDAVYTMSMVAEYDMNGRLIAINDLFLRLIGRTKDEMLGKYQGAFSAEGLDIESFNKFWDELKRGKTKRMTQHVKINNKELWLSEAYTPILDSYGKPYKVLNISIDITDSVLSQSDRRI